MCICHKKISVQVHLHVTVIQSHHTRTIVASCRGVTFLIGSCISPIDHFAAIGSQELRLRWIKQIIHYHMLKNLKSAKEKRNLQKCFFFSFPHQNEAQQPLVSNGTPRNNMSIRVEYALCHLISFISK